MPETNTNTQTQQPQQYELKDFAAKIKSRYPNDKKLQAASDQDIADRWIKKYPADARHLKGYKKPEKTTQEEPDPTKMQASMTNFATGGGGKAMVDYALTALPSIGGAASMLGKATGPVGYLTGAALADVGGAGGKLIEILGKKGLYGSSYGPHGFDIIHQSALEGEKQAELDIIGRLMGDGFYKVASKIPHVQVKNGIPLLPSQISGDRFTKFVEDLLKNVWPSSKAFQAVEKEQTAKIIAKGEEIGDTIGKFRGSREQLGIMIRQAIKGAENAAKPDPAKFASKQLFDKAYDQWISHFNEGLLGAIKRKGNPANIAALLTSDSFSETEVNTVIDYLAEHRSAVLDYTRSSILGDAIDKAIRGNVDPTIKGAKQVDDALAGNKFRKELDKIGETRLRTIFNGDELKNIENFEKTISRVGGASQGWIGRFKNFAYLTYALGGFTGGLHGAATQAGIFYVMGKIMTNPKGAAAYETIIKGMAAGAPRVVYLGQKEYKEVLEQYKREYNYKRKEAEQDFMKANNITQEKEKENK